MTTADLLKKEAETAFADFLAAIEGLSQSQAWGRLVAAGEEYLHTDGSVQGIALHVASSKKAYGSFAFRDSEFRWRDVANEVEPLERSWDGVKLYLEECHAYWIASWGDLDDSDLESEVLHFSGKIWPVWRIIQTVTHHDQYHAGQIAIVRFAALPSETPPPSVAEDIRTHCRELPTW